MRARGPGRLNLIGEHTDYNHGLALPFAIGRGVTVTAEPLDGDRVLAFARDLGEEDEFELADPGRVRGWRAFVRGVAAKLRTIGLGPPGARIEIEGDVPRASGLSSSAALSTALCLAFLGLRGDADSLGRLEVARLCSWVENDWVGARTGLLDQLAALFCREDHALLIDFDSLALTHVPLRFGGWTLATLDSGAPREISASGYNDRRAECAEACQLLGVTSLRYADADRAAELPDPLDRRVRHVLEENARVEAALTAVEREDLGELGRLLDACHASLRDLYDVSAPELERAVERMKDAGAAGARLVGAGFGGSVLGIFPPGHEPPDGAIVAEPGPAAHFI